ncbi:MAG: ABC transporter substrate-binding protein [Bacteroidota bacterium]|nr:ABC transporter substrate-binding protein [Bacteroidota bacterium]
MKYLLFVLPLFYAPALFSQSQPSTKKIKIAVLCPLYLDSAFNNYTYLLGNKNMPQYILTGLDFYNGVMLAIDSLNKENTNAEVWIYDTKKAATNISSILQSMKWLNFSLIIASLTNSTEQKAVSDFSFANNIPVVSVTYPNDAGVIANPFFVLLNSTLQTHVAAIYRFVEQNFYYNKPLFITKSGASEKKILSDFRANDTIIKNHFAYRVLELNTISFDKIKPYLDSTKQNVIVCGSLNSDFAADLVTALGTASKYKTTIIGMPNWDGVRKIFNNNFSNVDIVYSTPFYYSPTDSLVQTITADYRTKFFGRPSDMVFKGFEAMYHYTHLLIADSSAFLCHASDTSYPVTNRFFIQPVMQTTQSLLPDYLENKNLYFIKKNSGSVVAVQQLRK